MGHVQAVIADLQRRLSVGDDQAGSSRQPGQILQQSRFRLFVQSTGAFVHQQDGRLRQNPPGDGDALLLAAGQAGGVNIRFLRQAHAGQQLVRPLLGLPLLPI